MEEKRIKIGINGLGRIGTVVLRAALKEKYPVDIVAINTKGNYDVATIAMRLKYDSVYGHFPEPISHTTDKLSYNGQTISLLTGNDPSTIPWGTYGVDVVLECTGKFIDNKAQDHIQAGAKKVIISAPVKDPTIPTYILAQKSRKNITVTLVGEGADEIFGGYEQYKILKLKQYLNYIPGKNILPILIKKSPKNGDILLPAKFAGANHSFYGVNIGGCSHIDRIFFIFGD